MKKPVSSFQSVTYMRLEAKCLVGRDYKAEDNHRASQPHGAGYRLPGTL